MKTASLKEIKKELETLHPSLLLNICIQLIKYKKENKELMSYLLFESDDEEGFITNIKLDIDEQFEEIKKSTLHIAKKQIRKSIRNTNKFIKYSGNKRTEVELRIHLCGKLKKTAKFFFKTKCHCHHIIKASGVNRKAIGTLHEDLQF